MAKVQSSFIETQKMIANENIMFNKVTETFGHIHQKLENIAAISEENSAVTEETLAAIEEQNKMVVEIAQSMDKISALSKELQEMGKEE